MDSFVDFEDNVDSFLSNDDGDGRDIFAALKKGPSEQESLKSKYFKLLSCAANFSPEKV